jgi:hypothetical protein
VAVKTSGDVIIEAELDPVVPANKANSVLTWTGGNAVTGNSLRRKVSKGTSAKTTVKAVCGTSEKEVDIWIIWANITIQTSGNQPSDAVPLPTTYGGGILGTFNTTWLGGAMTLEAQITPSGVKDVVKSGWKIKRTVTRMFWLNGVLSLQGTGNDDSYDSWVVSSPTAKDCIYDTDAPSVNKSAINIGSNGEYHGNFTQWIEWNSTTCSDNKTWHVEYKCARTSAGYNVIYNSIGAGTITIPNVPTNP